MELAGSLNLAGGFELGGYYGYADYTYESFSEPVGGKNLDRAGKDVYKRQFPASGNESACIVKIFPCPVAGAAICRI